MATQAIRSLVKRLTRSSKVERLHPQLRHAYATLFLINGDHVFLLKQNLGRTTLAMVEQYLHVANRLAAVRSQTFSRLDRMNKGLGRRFGHRLNGTRSDDERPYRMLEGARRPGSIGKEASRRG